MAALGALFQGACTSNDCYPGYVAFFDLPAAANASNCTLTLSSPTNTLQYDLASPAPGESIACATIGAPLECSRSPASMGAPQVVGLTVGITQASDFEHLVGGADFTVSLLCGTTTVLDNDPQSMGSICEL